MRTGRTVLFLQLHGKTPLGTRELYEHAPDKRYALQKSFRERAVSGSPRPRFLKLATPDWPCRRTCISDLPHSDISKSRPFQGKFDVYLYSDA
jgi:hypothetical protein